MTCGSTKGLKAHSDELRLTRAAEVCCAEKRKFPISAETQPSAEATCVKIRSCESALRVDTFFCKSALWSIRLYGQSGSHVYSIPRRNKPSSDEQQGRLFCFANFKCSKLEIFRPRWTGFKGAVTMELFSRRRWRLALAQVVSCDIYEMPKQLRLFMNDSNQIRQIQASPS